MKISLRDEASGQEQAGERTLSTPRLGRQGSAPRISAITAELSPQVGIRPLFFFEALLTLGAQAGNR